MVLLLCCYCLITRISQNVRVEAFIGQEIWNKLDVDISEGNIYSVVNFTTVERSGKLSHVPSMIIIKFMYSTRIDRIIGDDWSVPLYKFDFTYLQDLSIERFQTFAVEGPHYVIGKYLNISITMEWYELLISLKFSPYLYFVILYAM